jgi:hypothetical protein
MSADPIIGMLKAARISYADVEWLTSGLITKAMLEKVATGRTPLAPNTRQVLTRLLGAHRSFRNGVALLVSEHRPEVKAQA